MHVSAVVSCYTDVSYSFLISQGEFLIANFRRFFLGFVWGFFFLNTSLAAFKPSQNRRKLW